MSVQKVSLCLFDCKPKPSRASLESPGLENIPQLPGNRDEVGQNYAYRDFDKLWVDFPKLGAYFPVPGTLS